MSFIWFILIGALAGFLAGKLMKGEGFGFWGNVVVGVVGAVIGGGILSLLGIQAGAFVTAFLGAVALLWVIKMVRK